MKEIIISRFLIITVISTLASGCTVLLPAHTSSNKRTGEKVSLTTIKCEDVLNKKSVEITNFITNYNLAYPGNKNSPMASCGSIFLQTKIIEECKPKSETATVVAPAALLASAAVGLATNFAEKKFEEEKALYTAQYTGSLSDDKFWKSVTFASSQKVDCTLPGGEVGELTAEGYILIPNYIGLELKREINGKDTASHTLYGFNVSSDGRFFQVKPLYFEMPYAKAKVLSDQWGTWIFPPTLLMKLFKISNNTVDVQLDFSMEAYWTDKGKEFSGPKQIAAFKTEISGYDLSDAEKLGADKLQNDSGWLLAPPISDAIERYAGTPAGNFTATVIATERDTSEATKIIEIGGDWVSKGGEKAQAIIEKKK